MIRNTLCRPSHHTPLWTFLVAVYPTCSLSGASVLITLINFRFRPHLKQKPEGHCSALFHQLMPCGIIINKTYFWAHLCTRCSLLRDWGEHRNLDHRQDLLYLPGILVNVDRDTVRITALEKTPRWQVISSLLLGKRQLITCPYKQATLCLISRETVQKPLLCMLISQALGTLVFSSILALHLWSSF